MRFLLDMGIAQSVARQLREQGHDALHLRDRSLQRLSDNAIVEMARTEERVILTHDLDFGRILALSRHHLPSVVTFRLRDMRPAQVNRYLGNVLSHYADLLTAGALVSVSEQAIRVRRLPVEDQES